MTYHYSIFGLNIQSEIAFYDLPVQKGAADVVIQYGKVPAALHTPKAKGVRYEASPGEFLLRVDQVAEYYVTGGNRIIIEPHRAGREKDISLFLTGSAMGALLFQRNMLPLHGSAVQIKGDGVILAGPSGVGKSTLAAGFHKQGHHLIADDICCVSTASNGQPLVLPGVTQLKLWADVLKKLEEDTDNLTNIRSNRDMEKFYLPVGRVCDMPTPVQSVFILATTNTDRFEITRLNGMDKISPVMQNIYRFNFVKGLGGEEKHFEACAELAASVPVFKIVRPRTPFLLNELMELIERNRS